jgi:DNA-binding transcriptional MerR regulator
MDAPDTAYLNEDEPIYSISLVTRLTGIPIATLRAWERRYHFPRSGRTSGGHRLYSEREMQRLRWVKAQLDEGLRIGQVLRSWQHLEQQGRVPHGALPMSAGQFDDTRASLAVFRERLVAALFAHEVEEADRVLADVLALYPLEDLILGMIGPALVDIEQAWLSERITVATEHHASHYLRHRLLVWMLSGPPTFAVRPIVLACAPGELHEGGLLIMGVLLRRQRWPVAYLGQSVPLPDLAAFVQETRPAAAVLVAMTEESARALVEWPRWLPDVAQSGRPLIGYGGRIFTEQPGWRQRIPGVFLGATLQEGVETLQRRLYGDIPLRP